MWFKLFHNNSGIFKVFLFKTFYVIFKSSLIYNQTFQLNKTFKYFFFISALHSLLFIRLLRLLFFPSTFFGCFEQSHTSQMNEDLIFLVFTLGNLKDLFGRSSSREMEKGKSWTVKGNRFKKWQKKKRYAHRKSNLSIFLLRLPFLFRRLSIKKFSSRFSWLTEWLMKREDFFMLVVIKSKFHDFSAAND